MTGMENILDQNHPSFGVETAMFLFAIGAKNLVVEAQNQYAVATLERLLIRNNQQVSEKCRVLCVFRECTEAGVRDDAVDEVPYIEFMMDIVNPKWLMNDKVTLACFNHSCSPKERTHALNRAKAFKATASPSHSASMPKMQAVFSPVKEQVDPDACKNLSSALSGLGFKKAETEKFVRNLGLRVNKEPITDLLREGIKCLAS